MMLRRIRIIILCAAAAVSAACSKQSLENAWSTQEDRIDSFIQSLSAEGDPDDPEALYVHDVIYNGGSNRVILRDGSGEGLRKGGTVSFYYTGYVFQGSLSAENIFATNDSQTAGENGWDITDASYEIKTLTLGNNDGLVPGLHAGLEGVKAGEICYILFSGQYGFGKKPVGTIPGNSALLYYIRVESVSN